MGETEPTGKKKRMFSDTPREIGVREMVEERAKEMSDLLALVHNHSLPTGEVSQGKRTFIQRLPRHLRRRAMSHNVKRLPKRLRPQATEILSISTHRKKPPSRYHRRRPRNLLEAYARRKRQHVWLETHIWHAKRFHMLKDYWGYRIADCSTARGFRASYRDSVRCCLIQDVSYLCCLELSGSESSLLQGLSQLTEPSLGKTFAYKAARSGSLETQVTVYRPAQYPFGCIGPVKFHWKPQSSVSDPNGSRKMWIWMNPSIWNEVLALLKTVFSLKEKRSSDTSGSHTLPCFEGPTVSLTLLKDRLVRFRLTGPEATRVLKASYSFSGFWKTENGETKFKTEDHKQILLDFEKSPETRNDLAAQEKDWERLQCLSPGQIQNGIILGGLLNDPRVSRPTRRTTLQNTDSKLPPSSDIPYSLPFCGLWDEDIRYAYSNCRQSDSTINEIRSENFGNPEAHGINRVPFLLINGRNAQSGSWDLILPSEWGRPFWVSAQFAAARAGGLRESRKVSFETCHLHFPEDWADTTASVASQSQRQKVLEAKHKKRPHNRRTQYGKLRVKYPFHAPWSELVDGWTGNWDHSAKEKSPSAITREDFYVLRERKALRQISEWISGKSTHLDEQLLKTHTLALIPVRVESVGKGCPKENAMICLPAESDEIPRGRKNIPDIWESETKEVKKATPEKDILDQAVISLSGEKLVEMEELFPDKEAEIQVFKKEKKRLKRLKAKLETNTSLSEGKHKSERPMTSVNVVKSCSRHILGFTVAGDSSFTIGKGMGLGYCSLLGLKALVEQWNKTARRFVLYRNTSTKCYRAAAINVLL